MSQFSITHNKIAPIYRCTRELVARPPRIRKTKPPFVEMWVGISAEERDKRCKPSREPWITNRWPLRELGMSRQDCERWLLERYGRVVFKSACVACPFHDDVLVIDEGTPARRVGAGL